MTTGLFITQLKDNPSKALLFEYKEEQYAGTNYHLTEIKKVHFDTVDCGGNPNEWNETHIQIWENPNERDKTEYMTTDKILSIFQKVDSIKLLDYDTELKVEYGNENFHTAVMKIKNIVEKGNQLIVRLFEEKTLCKAPSELPEGQNKTSACCSSTKGCC